MINVLFFTSKSTYSGGKNKLTLKHNYNSISKAIQKEKKKMSLPTPRESRKFHRIDELGLRGSKRLGSQQSEKAEKVIPDKHMECWKNKTWIIKSL